MLDQYMILTKGGTVLFEFREPAQPINGTPINSLIQSVLIEERGTSEKEKAFQHKTHGVHYKLDNDLGLVHFAVFMKSLETKLGYVPTLLAKVQKSFAKKHADSLKANPFQPIDFRDEFDAIRFKVEDQHRNEAKSGNKMRGFLKSKKYDKSLQSSKDKVAAAASPSKGKEPKPKEQEPEAAAVSLDKDEQIKLNIERMKAKGAGGKSKGGMGRFTPKKKGKGGSAAGTPTKEPESLDYSNSKATQQAHSVDVSQLAAVGQLRGNVPELDYESSDDEDEGDTPKASKGVFSFFKSFAGESVMTEEALVPVLEKTRMHLIGKNVAAEIADKLCDSVKENLMGQTKGSFRGIASVVKESFQSSLTRILTPKREVDILKDVMEAKKKGKPFVTVFCGVNGVGKSTNLSKIAFWLLDNNCRILIAACDTFRAGAVEQLRTHLGKLRALHPTPEGQPERIQLYDRGYGKDDAAVARDAAKFARDEHYDVVLVDTAGRMQDNEHLMRSLAKLIKVNLPDLILFVGEALVGTEAVDQLAKFNQALVDFSDMDNPRTIDGIVLSKFDTIDDKVGASISMTYTTGQPIVFVGTGQTYTDLKRLHVKSIVHSLLN